MSTSTDDAPDAPDAPDVPGDGAPGAIDDAPAPDPAQAGHPRRRQVLAVCCLSLLLVVVAVSSLNIAVPELQRGLDASATELLWIVDVYALVFAGTLLPAGALGDRFGRKGALLVGLGVFGTGALLAGLSGSPLQVVGARAVMGVGAGFVMPATLSIITTVFPAAERPKAIAVWAGFAGAGGALGPVASGLVLEVWSWNAVFFITLPVVAATVVLVARLVPTSRDPQHTRLDPLGAVLSVVGLFALLFGTIQGPEHGWGSAPVAGAFVVAAAALAAFVGWELRSSHPMLDPRLFRIRAFATGSATITLLFFVTFGMFFLVAQYLQFVKGYSPLVAGVAMVPSGLTLILVAPRGPRVAARLGAERTVALGLGSGAVGFAVLSQLDPGTPYPWLVVALVLMAAGSGLAMPASTAAIVGSVPAGKAGVGSAVNDVTREVGGALGIAVFGSIVSARYRSAVAATAEGLPGDVRHAVEESIGRAVAAGSGDELVTAAARDAFASAAATAFVVAAVLLAAGSLAHLRRCRGRRVDTPLEVAARTATPGDAVTAAVPCAR
jgi:EmrB/QacA subfamily drug resistance transporter